MAKEKAIAYKLAGFEMPQFKSAWEHYDSSAENIELNNNIDFSFSAENNTLKCTNDVTFVQGDTPVLEIQFCTFVEVDPESIPQLMVEGQLVFPPHFLAQCASFGHGALRGIMFLKTTNTPFEGVIIPPVEYHKVFKEPFVVNMSGKE
ncbi:MAG: hypothetical protein IJT97_03420 [Bacteroidaceae bacterium]|nr:hypothetical protein [Bacteroidaceae bacterium]